MTHLFQKVTSELNGASFQSMESVKTKAALSLTNLAEEDVKHCFAQRKIRMLLRSDFQGEYIEGDKASDVIGDE